MIYRNKEINLSMGIFREMKHTRKHVGATTIKQYKYRKFDGKINRYIYSKIDR